MMEFSNGGTYLFYGTISILSAVFVWKYIPETKGETLKEMEGFWKKNAVDNPIFNGIVFLYHHLLRLP